GAKDAVSWSPTGDELAYAFNGEIYAMSADGSNKRRLTNSPDGMGSFAPTWAPDGIAIAFWRGTSVFEGDGDAPEDSEIYVVGVGAGEAFRLTHDDHASFQPAWSPDSSQIAYRRTNPDDIVVMNADGTGGHAVTPAALNPWSPAARCSKSPCSTSPPERSSGSTCTSRRRTTSRSGSPIQPFW
ncbi:MAG TPA: hypothetical protein VF036_07605, partial [Actinomycetota bacterium]